VRDARRLSRRLLVAHHRAWVLGAPRRVCLAGDRGAAVLHEQRDRDGAAGIARLGQLAGDGGIAEFVRLRGDGFLDEAHMGELCDVAVTVYLALPGDVRAVADGREADRMRKERGGEGAGHLRARARIVAERDGGNGPHVALDEELLKAGEPARRRLRARQRRGGRGKRGPRR
jgi:hypothetical protein